MLEVDWNPDGMGLAFVDAFPPLFRYARRYASSDQEAEDLAGDAVARVLKRIKDDYESGHGPLQIKTNLLSFLKGVVTWLWLGQQPYVKSTRVLPYERLTQLASSTPDEIPLFVNESQWTMFRHLQQALDPIVLQAFVYRAVHRLTFNEMCPLLGVKDRKTASKYVRMAEDYIASHRRELEHLREEGELPPESPVRTP